MSLLYPILLVDDFTNILEFIENDALAEGCDANQSLAITHNPPIPQQAYGSENGIMYQIHPMLFPFITGNFFVSQQPKGNNRSRYACDGRRYLPDSRYHPMAIQVRFFFRTQKVFSYDFQCFSYRICDRLYYGKIKF